MTGKSAFCKPSLICVIKIRYKDQDGTTVTEDEHILVIKTRSDAVEKIGEYFNESHPYKLPELVTFKVRILSLKCRIRPLTNSILGRSMEGVASS